MILESKATGSKSNNWTYIPERGHTLTDLPQETNDPEDMSEEENEPTEMGIRIETRTSKAKPIQCGQIVALLLLLGRKGCAFQNYREEEGITEESDTYATAAMIEELDEDRILQYVDLSQTPWGPRKDKLNERAAFSFYMTSKRYKKVGDLKQDKEIMEFLQKRRWFVSNHRLHESQVVNAAYIMRKNPDRTYREGLTREVTSFFEEHKEAFDDLELSIVYAQIEAEGNKVLTLAVQCGMSQRDIIDEILE